MFIGGGGIPGPGPILAPGGPIGGLGGMFPNIGGMGGGCMSLLDISPV